jgi:hypothetical protein
LPRQRKDENIAAMPSFLPAMKIVPALLAGSLLVVAGTGRAAGPAEPGKAIDRCEAAVAETVERIRGKDAREVEFIGARRQLLPSPGDEADIKGEGRYRRPGGDAVGFTYSCAFNVKTGATSGVVFRETGSARGADEAKAWEPDLSSFSPDGCESAIAASLKGRYPRVGRIAFDADTRRLRPASNALTSLEGQGAVERAPGMNSVPFSYRCEFEARGGKVLRVETRD